jgi:hypothetical protein
MSRKTTNNPAKALVLALFPALLFFTQVSAAEDNVNLSGAFLGAFNTIKQDNRADTEEHRSQFDFAANINMEWKIKKNITGVFQFQASPGDGSLAFPGPETQITDLNITFAFEDPDICLTVGSFDTPFGEQTGYLTNNADAFRNPLFLNSLFYSAFAGAPTSTLNALGIRGTLSSNHLDATLAVTNGTDATADNQDGNFGVSGILGLTPSSLEKLRLAVSLMYSKDNSEAGTSGFRAEFSAFLAEGRYRIDDNAHIAGYCGLTKYGDGNTGTDDEVIVCMGQFRYGIDRWHLAVRVSGWSPGDDNGDDAGISQYIPNPGLAIEQAGVVPYTDQNVRRIQIGGGFAFDDNLVLKGEIFQDNYSKTSDDESTDVEGLIVTLNGRF